MYQVIIYKGVNWKKGEKKYEDYKKVFSSEILSLDDSTELFAETSRNTCCTSKGIYIQQVELQNNNIKIINEHKTDPDGKDLSFIGSTVKEDIEQYKNQDMFVSVFDYRVGKFIVDDLPIKEMKHLSLVLDLDCESIEIIGNEIHISVNS